MDYDQFKKILKDRLSPELYLHSLGVAKTAAELAGFYRADRDRATLAGLIHDYAKEIEPLDLLKRAEQLGVTLDAITRVEGRKLLHAPVGAALLAVEMGIEDPEILSAVSCHTTGRPGMTVLDQVIYLADFIEPNRDFPGVEDIRIIARAGLDIAVLAVVNTTIALVLERGLMLHPDSINLRNDLIARIRERGNGG